MTQRSAGFREWLLPLLAVFLLFTPLLTDDIDAEVTSSEENGRGYLGMSLSADFRFFNDQSPWNKPIGEDPEIDPFSDLMINHLKKKAKRLKGATTRWTIPIHVIDSRNCPRVDILSMANILPPEIDPDRNKLVEDLPIPRGVWSDPEEDGHMVLVDPLIGCCWDYGRARVLADGSLTAHAIYIWDLNGPGYRPAFEGKYWWAHGAMGSGMPLAPGLIRPEEIEAGEINHALLCATPINRKTTYPGGNPEVCSPPASKTDGDGVGFGYIPEGARFQLDPDLDLAALGLSPASRVVARAMQEYGMYNGMGARDFKIFFQNLGPDGGKWRDYGSFLDLEKIPIERFRIIKCNLVIKP